MNHHRSVELNLKKKNHKNCINRVQLKRQSPNKQSKIKYMDFPKNIG